MLDCPYERLPNTETTTPDESVSPDLVVQSTKKATDQGINGMDGLLNSLLQKYLDNEINLGKPVTKTINKVANKTPTRLTRLEAKYKKSKKVYKVTNGNQFISAVFGQ